MDELVEIIKIIIWPTTIILSVIILRNGLNGLIPKLIKLKYKDLELEFQKEALDIQAIAERDIPKTIPTNNVMLNSTQDSSSATVSKPIEVDRGENSCLKEQNKREVSYSIINIEDVEPKKIIQISWDDIEDAILANLSIRDIEHNNMETTKSLVNKLVFHNIIDKDIAHSILSLNAFKNKVMHVSHEIINKDASMSFYQSCKLVEKYLESMFSSANR